VTALQYTYSYTMTRCLHIDNKGQQCPQEAEANSAFCSAHEAPPQIGFRLAAWRKFLFRVAALILLLLILLQAYVLLKVALG